MFKIMITTILVRSTAVVPDHRYITDQGLPDITDQELPDITDQRVIMVECTPTLTNTLTITQDTGKLFKFFNFLES